MIIRICQSAVRTLPRHRGLAGARHQTRCYLGGAGEMKAHANDDAVARREQALWDKAQPRYDAIMERHTRLPVADEEGKALDVRKKRLIYRSKQRGWLEVDLLLGTWASENVPGLTAAELDEFENFVNAETIDIYNILTLRVDVPEDMCSRVEGGRSLVQKIQQWAKESPLGKADKERYVEVKTKNNLI